MKAYFIDYIKVSRERFIEKEIEGFLDRLDDLKDDKTEELKIEDSVKLVGEIKYNDNGEKVGYYIDLFIKEEKKTFETDSYISFKVYKEIIKEIMKEVEKYEASK